jgi:hypothetical protein
MSDSSSSDMLAKSADGMTAGRPSCLTPCRTIRSQSDGLKSPVRPPRPAVMFGPSRRPISGLSTITPPPKF